MAPPKDKRTPEDMQAQEELRRSGNIPTHIAIIMDGNGRWAERQGRDRVFGHRHGVESVRDITEACTELGVRYLTLYTFSTENWKRPVFEVNALMELLVKTIRRETKTLEDNDVRLSAIGDLSKLPDVCRKELMESIGLTQNNRRMTLTLALSYSGRWEVLEAVKSVAVDAKAGNVDLDVLSEADFSRYLSTGDMPDPDLLVRTGGEYRVSNFMLWQLAYTELHITQKAWPAFRRPDLYAAIREYQSRERRFGAVPAMDAPAGQ